MQQVFIHRSIHLDDIELSVKIVTSSLTHWYLSGLYIMTHLSREEAERIQRERGRVVVSMKLVNVHIQWGSTELFALTAMVAGSIVFRPEAF